MANVITQSGTIASVPQGGTYAFDAVPVDGTTVLVGLNKIGFGSSGTYAAVGEGTPLPVAMYGSVAGSVYGLGTFQALGTVQPLAGSVHVANAISGTVQPLAGSVHVANVVFGTFQAHGTNQALGTVQPLAGSVHLASRVPGTVDVGAIAGTVQVLGSVQPVGTVQALGTLQPLAGSVHLANTISGTVQTHGTSQMLGTVTATAIARAGSTAHVHAPAANTAATVSYSAAGGGISHVIGGVAWSYNAVPTSGNLKIEDGVGTTVFTADITNSGPGVIPFAPPLKGAANTAMVVTLAAGGASVTGKVNVLGKWTE